MPKGEILCVRDGEFVRWYLKENGKRIYISKKKRALAEKLAVKKYLSTILKNLNHEKRAIEFYLKHHNSNQEEQFLKTTSIYYELLTPYFNLPDEENRRWITAEYERNLKYPEQLIFKTSSGSYVRSKSEMVIDMFLRINKIPFRYGCALQLGEITIYPGFTIKHPLSGEIFYWKHFGMMDDVNYCKNAYSKLQLYSANGIIPTVNLIMTFETKEHPLGTDIIENIIEFYFK